MTALNKQALRMRNYLDTAFKSGVKLLHLSTDELEGLLDENESMVRDLISRDGEIEGLRQRIAELEARTVTLPPTFWYEHDDLSRDIPVLDKRLVKKEIRAAGIGVKGE